MQSRLLEARLAKIEANPRFGALASLSDEELEREIVRHMNVLVGGFSTYDAMFTHYEASPEPFERQVGKDMRAFLAGYVARHPQQVAR